LPTEDRIVFERFFDEIGDSHLVIHSPLGSRINKAWGSGLRKRMCRKFNFELQASALEDSIVLSLGPTHSFALDEVRHYLKPPGARAAGAGACSTRRCSARGWRWNATASLAVRRMNGGTQGAAAVPAQRRADLLTVVFPDPAGLRREPGRRARDSRPPAGGADAARLPARDDGRRRLRAAARSASSAARSSIVARDLASPSPLSHAILNARPYAFLDDGAAEERRTKTVRTRR
jgi:ATP-dependent Lhr-like helicase